MRWFNNLSVGPKFGLIGGLLFLLVLIVAGTGFWSASQLNNSLEGVTTDQIPEILNLSYVRDGFETTRALTYASLLGQDAATINQLTENIRQQLGAIEKRLDDYIEGDQPESEKAIVQKIGQDFKDWTNQTQQLITLAEANTPQARQEARQLLAQHSTQEFADDLSQVLDINQRESDQNRVQATQVFETISYIIGFVTLLIVLVGLLALSLLARSIINLTNQQQALNKELKEAVSKLEDRYRVGQNITRRLRSVTAQLSTTSTQQASGSREQAAAITQITNFLGEVAEMALITAEQSALIDSAAQQILVSTQEVKVTAQNVSETGRQGQEAMHRSLSANHKVSNFYEGLLGLLEDLQQRSSVLKRVLDLIGNINKETHLLALNAAIEAAGAGEYGERFKVVAGNVKELSQRSNAACQEIISTLNGLQTRISEAVTTAQQGQQETAQAVVTAEQSETVIGELVAALYQTQAQISQVEVALTEMTDLSRTINQTSREQAVASEQAVQNLQNIDIIARQSAKSSVEVSHTAQEIDGLGQELNLALVV